MPRCERERSPIANSRRIKVPDREVHVDTVMNAGVQVPATAVVGRADNFGLTRRRGGEHDVVGPHHGDGIGWSGTVEVNRPQHSRGVIRDGEEARRAHEAATKSSTGWWYTSAGVPSCRIRPFRITAMRSPIANASCWSWVTNTAGVPVAFNAAATS